jgi:quinoprotein dehydrogenase-associated probable ABC transporter substrate-binding protein
MRSALRIAGLALSTLIVMAIPSFGQETSTSFRVCADPNNLPFSNRAGEGFENKLAQFIASKLGKPVSYTWWAQRRGFIRSTLKAGDCDVIMGVPPGLAMVEATRPYYRSTYVFVSRADRHYNISSLKDPRLRELKIGVQLIGDDGSNTPPAHVLSDEGMIRNIVGFTVYGDYSQPNPPARIVEAVEKGTIDIAAVWGPLAGYFAQRSATPLNLAPIADGDSFRPFIFQYDIAIGVRKGNDELRDAIDRVLSQYRDDVDRLLADYGVPLVK